MRTTIDLPSDLHEAARSIARDRGTTLSAAVADLIRRGLGQSGAVVVDDHLHHVSAERWSASVPATFATCPGTQGSLVRFLVREGASGDEARQFLSEVTADGRHRFWPDDLAYDTVDLGAVVAIVSHRCQSRCAGPGPRRPAGDPG